jgi:hypothetical protein
MESLDATSSSQSPSTTPLKNLNITTQITPQKSLKRSKQGDEGKTPIKKVKAGESNM